MTHQKFSDTLEQFIQSDDFVDAIVSSTKASWGGSGYSVELFADDRYRVLADMQIGNLYQSDGIVLGVPKLTDEEQDEADDEPFEGGLLEVVEFYRDEKAEQMRDALAYTLEQS